MQDRPDLIQSELSGLAFDSCQQLFRSSDLEIMFTQPCPQPIVNEEVYLVVDPAAGGPQSNYAIITATRQKGMITVRFVGVVYLVGDVYLAGARCAVAGQTWAGGAVVREAHLER